MLPSLPLPLMNVRSGRTRWLYSRVFEDSVRGKMLAVAGVGTAAGMVLWGVVGLRSLAGPTAVFAFAFLVLLVLSAICEGCKLCRRG